MILDNQGLVRIEFSKLFLTVKGIEKDTEIGLFENMGNPISIANFPENFVKTNVLKKVSNKNVGMQITENSNNDGQSKGKVKKWFVEPGIVQKFTYVLRIPENIRFILVRSSFDYQKNSEHSVQKVFEIITK
jgi:hypothetical protein